MYTIFLIIWLIIIIIKQADAHVGTYRHGKRAQTKEVGNWR